MYMLSRLVDKNELNVKRRKEKLFVRPEKEKKKNFSEWFTGQAVEHDCSDYSWIFF